MLISGVAAPRDVPGLREFLINIVPTALGFTVLLSLWHGHYTFFRRYGVADKTIIFLNAVPIFVVLFMAYPLRFAARASGAVPDLLEIVAALAWLTDLNATAAAGFGLFLLAYLFAEKRYPSKHLKTAYTES